MTYDLAERYFAEPGSPLFTSMSGMASAGGDTHVALWLLHWDERRGVFILHKEYEKLGWFSVAGILRNNVDIIGRFVKRLAWSKGHRFTALDLHNDGTLKDIDECVRVVSVLAGRGTWRILDREHHHFLARHPSQALGHKRGDFGVLNCGWSGETQHHH